MKRVFTIIAAGLLTFFAASCVNEKQAIFDDALATPPVLGSYDIGEDAVTASYTPGAFNTSFNTSIAPKHSFAIVKLNGEDVSRTIASSEKDGKLTVKLVNLIRAGIALGAQEGSSASMELAIRASMQDPARDNGVNGFVDSEAHITIPSLEMIIPEIVGSPYEEYVEASAWTLIGAISEYGISWDGDLNMWTDGAGNHVAAHVKLKAGDEVKFRKDQKWDENYGGDFSTLGEEFKVSQDGPNIKITADGIYDLFLYESGQTAMVSEAYDPYPDYVQASDWSVIGALPAHGISWDGDIAMVTDGTTHVAFSVQIGAADEFKFRQGRDWAVNLGGEFGGLDNDFPVTQDGPNIIVGAAGVYDLFVVPGDGTAKVTAASGLRVSGKVSNDTPEPPAPSGWGIIGDFNGWGGDAAMTEDAGVWTGFFTNADKEDGSHGAFKVRKDADWAENYGAPGDEEPVEVTLGEAMPVVAGGKNFSSPAGLYKVVLNLTDESNPTLTVSAGDVYSLIGQINGTSWDTDFELTEADGVYTSEVVFISGGFKIRHNFSWDDANTYGAEGEVTVGTAFTAVQPGSDISVPEGNYKVQFTPATKEVLISAVEYELPDIDLSQYEVLDIMAGADTWGIIGPAVISWDTDYDLAKIQDDPEIWAAMNVPFQAGAFKFRGNDTWGDYDLGGGAFALNTPIVMTKGGGDMTAERGVYTVYLYPTYGIAYLTEGSGDVPPPPAKPEVWSLIGTVGGTAWDTDFDLENTSGDVWKIRNVAIAESDEFKLRADHDWNVNVGGPEENDVSTIEEGNAYGVYKPTIGTAFETGSLNIRIGAAGNYDITFDYAANTILIEEYKEYPEHMYMIGEAIGGWDWNADYIIDMIPVINNQWGGDATGQFYAIRWLPAGQGFKFCAQKAWSGDFWGLETNDGFTESGGNCTVDADGIYLIHIDLKNSKVHVEPARVYGIGDTAEGKWDEGIESALYKADGKSLKLTLASSGSVRAYVASEIATSSWWTREFAVIDGKIVYRTGDELSWPAGSKDQVVTFNFNDGTGSIEGEAAPAEPYALIGWHANDSWSTNVDLIDVDGQPNWKVAKYIGANGGNIDFKFRRGSAWVPQVGAENKNPKNLNELFRLKEKTEGSEPDPANIHLDGNGVYDVYFNEKEMLGFILDAGSAFAVPTTWESGDTPEMDWYIIGEAVGGWDSENDVPFVLEGDEYVAKNVTILGGKNFKFRANHAWTYQLTCPGMRTIGLYFDLQDGNGENNDMQIPADGVYDVYMTKDLKQAVIMTAKDAPQTEVKITIDGNFDDWANVTGAEPSDAFNAFKVTNDADNFYFYVETDPGSRLWTGGGYLYLYFNFKNDLTQGAYGGATGMHDNKYDAYIFMYLFGGSADAPKIEDNPNGGEAKGMTMDNIVIAGNKPATSSDIVKMEIVIPRANFETKVNAGDVIAVDSYRSKDGGNVYFPGYVVK